MCVVSAIGDYYKPHFPSPFELPTVQPAPPGLIPGTWPPVSPFDVEKARKLRDLIEAAKKMDEVMGEPDCESVEKAGWLKQIFDRLDAIEKKIEQKGVV